MADSSTGRDSLRSDGNENGCSASACGLPVESVSPGVESGRGAEVRSTYEQRREAFERFHRANPHVYRHLVALARKAKRAGARVGIRLCWERLRWAEALKVVRLEGDYRLNDHFPPFYARLIAEREADLAGYFELRDRPAFTDPDPQTGLIGGAA